MTTGKGLLAMLTVAASAAAQVPPDPAALLSQAEAALKQYRTVQFSLDRTIEVRFAATRKRLTDRTSVVFANPDRLRIESKGQIANHLLVSDTGGTWIYDTDTKSYGKIPAVMDLTLSVSSLGLPIAPGVALMPLMPAIVSQETIMLDGQKHDCWIVQGSGQGEFGGGDYQEPVWTLWLDKKSGIELKSTFSARLMINGAWCQMDFTSVKHSLKLNTPVPESRFTFAVPRNGKEGSLGQVIGGSDLFFDASVSGKLNLADMAIQVGDKPLEMEGHPLLLVYAPLWCEPCRQSMPTLERLHQEYMGQGLVVVQYTAAADLATLQKVIQSSSPVAYTLVYGPEDKGDFKISGYPTFVLVDKTGNVVGNQTGFGSKPGYDEAALRRLLMRAGLGRDASQRQESQTKSRKKKKNDKADRTPPL
ncbi:MAG TPA: thioredoxin-like domain-containing protein [Bryobacteraceae bacterium]|nr:thioredoxin-like domain-containing protein [Bryobacteraceae bacterium]